MKLGGQAEEHEEGISPDESITWSRLANSKLGLEGGRKLWPEAPMVGGIPGLVAATEGRVNIKSSGPMKDFAQIIF